MFSGVTTICFAGSYAVALLLELSRLVFRSGVRGALMVGFAAAGLVAHSASLYHEAARCPRSPLSSERDWYLLAAWLLVVVYLYLTVYHPKQAFGLFLLPVVLALIGVAYFLATPASYPRESASRVWGIVHGTSILLATVVVLFGFVTGLMYLEQARRLKRKRPPIRGLGLPSLEWLRRANSRAIVVSLILLGVGVFSGMVLSRLSHAGRIPWNDPLVLGTLGMFLWLLAAVVVRTRFREVMLPLLLLPLLMPILSGAVRATSDLLLRGEVAFEPIQLLLVSDAVYLIVSFVGFEYVLDE